MTLFTLYVAAGILNVVVSFDQGILMVSMPRWRRTLEAWVEAGLYLLLWPLQLGYWVLTKVHLATGGILARMFR